MRLHLAACKYLIVMLENSSKSTLKLNDFSKLSNIGIYAGFARSEVVDEARPITPFSKSTIELANIYFRFLYSACVEGSWFFLWKISSRNLNCNHKIALIPLANMFSAFLPALAFPPVCIMLCFIDNFDFSNALKKYGSPTFLSHTLVCTQEINACIGMIQRRKFMLCFYLS